MQLIAGKTSTALRELAIPTVVAGSVRSIGQHRTRSTRPQYRRFLYAIDCKYHSLTTYDDRKTMSTQMADPHVGMVSFQEGLQAGILELVPVPSKKNLYAHFDLPAPDTPRLTYVQLASDRKTVRAFLACIRNGQIDNFPCMAVGYAVPENLRNQGLAKQILTDVMQEQIALARQGGHSALYIEAVIDIENLSSQRVAEAVFNVEREDITDSESGRPAYRYTKRLETA